MIATDIMSTMLTTDFAWKYLACILFSSFGGLAKVLNMSTTAPVTWKIALREIILSTFAGTVALMICINQKVELEIVGAVCGIVGYVGIKIIEFLGTPFVKKFFGITTDTTSKEKDKEE